MELNFKASHLAPGGRHRFIRPGTAPEHAADQGGRMSLWSESGRTDIDYP